MGIPLPTFVKATPGRGDGVVNISGDPWKEEQWFS